MLFEGALVVLALVLAPIFGVRPWEDLGFSYHAMLVGLLGTVPMVLGFLILLRASWRWVQSLHSIIEQTLLPLFKDVGVLGIALVALFAGIGEELLFRGVFQAGLEQWLGSVVGLIIASLLFGLAHYVTHAYFLFTVVAGLYLGLLYQWTGNLLVPILVHALYDFIALKLYLSRRTP